MGSITKQKCPLCRRRMVGLKAHLEARHPEALAPNGDSPAPFLLLDGKLYKRQEVTCPCGSTMTLKKGKYGIYYRCDSHPTCKLTRSARQRNGTPLGDPSKRRLSELHQMVKSELDHLWKTGKLTKEQAYALLKGSDINGLDEEQCKALVQEMWEVG